MRPSGMGNMPDGLQGGKTTRHTIQPGGDELFMLLVVTPKLPIINYGVKNYITLSSFKIY